MFQKDLQSKELAKLAAAKEAAKFVKSGMTVGLGTGSTAQHFIKALAERIFQEHLNIQAVSSSISSTELAQSLGLIISDINAIQQIDLTVDGADEIDPQFRMIKGGGGSLFREKILAAMSQQVVIIVDQNKCVISLGKFPLAVEIVPFGYVSTVSRLERLGFEGSIRKRKNSSTPYLTDNGNYIFDIQLDSERKDPEQIEKTLKQQLGVVETGFFFNLATTVLIGHEDGTVEKRDENNHSF